MKYIVGAIFLSSIVMHVYGMQAMERHAERRAQELQQFNQRTVLAASFVTPKERPMLALRGNLDNGETIAVYVRYKRGRLRNSTDEDRFKPYYQGRINKKKLSAAVAELWVKRLIRVAASKRDSYRPAL